jgi:hypothetical protein
MNNAERQTYRLLSRAGVGVVVTIAVMLAAAGSGIARAQAKPVNTSAPTISGTAQVGNTLTGSSGTWTNNPTKYDVAWIRCDKAGGFCAGISGANSNTYAVTSGDVGHTIRFRVTATNADGTTVATSGATVTVTAPAKPANTSAPTVSGTPQEGKTLTGSRGSWTNGPARYDVGWIRCDRAGGFCAGIGGANNTTYTVTSADVGHTIRFRVTATNSGGSTVETSTATAVVTSARGDGCPAGGNPDQVASIAPPARLLIDTLQSDPQVVSRGTSTLVVRFHVTSTCGGPVQGALVYATATPYNQFSIPPEATTGVDGWAELRFQRLQGFPVSRRQQLIAMFVRARKPGESLLGGISTRRLVSVRVELNR